ncbi:MAG: hypothetical protein ACRC0X_03530 [Brevinema sp.]
MAPYMLYLIEKSINSNMINYYINKQDIEACEKLLNANIIVNEDTLQLLKNTANVNLIKLFKKHYIQLTVNREDIRYAFKIKKWEYIAEIFKNGNHNNKIIEETLFPNLSFNQEINLVEFLLKHTKKFSHILEVLHTEHENLKPTRGMCYKKLRYKDVYQYRFSGSGRIRIRRIKNEKTFIREIDPSHQKIKNSI